MYLSYKTHYIFTTYMKSQHNVFKTYYKVNTNLNIKSYVLISNISRKYSSDTKANNKLFVWYVQNNNRINKL